MKILERMRLENLLRNNNQSQQDLNLILKEWKFDNKPIKSAKEFISKFSLWINYQTEQKNELDKLLKKHSCKDLNALDKKLKSKGTWSNLLGGTSDQKLEGEFNEKLRAINILFDPNAKNYEKIEFDGLFSLLKKVHSDQSKLTKELEQSTDNLSKKNKLLDLEQSEVNKLEKEIDKLKDELEELKKENKKLAKKK